jgi:hypothetical protein
MRVRSSRETETETETEAETENRLATNAGPE